jgi:SAM-dependent methyltransferase
LPRGKQLSDAILTAVERYYSGRFAEHGATARGVDWNSPESQELRFEQLLRVTDRETGSFSLNDFGCGYGALAGFLRGRGPDVDYRGYDLSESMLEYARAAYADATFVGRVGELAPADYTVASGIFNVKLDVPVEEWREYVLATIETIAELSHKGFAFNMLTSYSDADKMRDDLYYGDPRFFFDLCKRAYSRHVALLHDYGLYEFTTIVRLGE